MAGKDRDKADPPSVTCRFHSKLRRGFAAVPVEVPCRAASASYAAKGLPKLRIPA